MIASLRNKKNLTRAMLAGAIGVPVATLRRWEDGTRSPKPKARERIRRTFRALQGLEGLELTHALRARCRKIADDNSLPVSVQVNAMQTQVKAFLMGAAIFKSILREMLNDGDQHEGSKP